MEDDLWEDRSTTLEFLFQFNDKAVAKATALEVKS